MHRVLQSAIILFSVFTFGLSQTNSLREANGTLIGTSPNGYNLVRSETSPITRLDDKIAISLKMSDGAPPSVLALAYSENFGESWEYMGSWNGPMYSSTIAHENSPMMFYNRDYQAEYSFDIFGWGGGLVNEGPFPTAPSDMSITLPTYSRDFAGNDFFNVAITDLRRGNGWDPPPSRDHYITHSDCGGSWEGGDNPLVWSDFSPILVEEEFISGGVDTILTSPGNMDVNGSGIGYYAVSAYWSNPLENANHTIYFKRTEDFGANWSGWYYISDETLGTYFTDVFPDSVLSSETNEWSFLPPEWSPFVLSELEILADPEGNLHVFAGVVPSDGRELILNWSSDNGLYHFLIDNNSFVDSSGALPVSINFIGSLDALLKPNELYVQGPGWNYANVTYSAAYDIEHHDVLYVVYHNITTAESSEQYLDLYGAYSTNGGRNWSTPIDMSSTPTRELDESDPHIFREAQDGAIFLNYQILNWDILYDWSKEDHPHDIYYWEYNFNLSPEQLNHAPELQNIANQEMLEDNELALTIPVVDIDGDILSFLATSLQDSINLTIADGVLNIDPFLDWSGTGEIIVEVADNFVSVRDTFLITVTPVSDPPSEFLPLQPENHATGLSQSPSFLWEESVDPDPFDFATYTLQIATDSAFSNLAYEMDTELSLEHEITEVLYNDSEYWWRVIATDTELLTTESVRYSFTVGYVSIEDHATLPSDFVLNQNFPNPFNPSTTLMYGIPDYTSVSLFIYDLRGNIVRTIETSNQEAGWYEYVWNGLRDDGQSVSAGLYLTRLQAGSYTKTVKMLYLK